jgi:hypothetical protein
VPKRSHKRVPSSSPGPGATRGPRPVEPPQPGTFAAEQAVAKTELFQLLAGAAQEPMPELARIYTAVQSAVAHAISIVVTSRSAKSLSPAAFIADFVRLEAETHHLKSSPQVSKSITELWPKDPGFTIAVYAGWSAMEAGWKFAEAIRNACEVARAIHRVPRHGMPYAVEQATGDECGPNIVAWTEMAIRELRERTLPVEHVWPSVAAIRREMAGYDFKLRHEYDRATLTAGPAAKQPPPRADGLYPGDRYVIGGKEGSLEHRQWLLLKFMWDRDSASIDEVVAHVWDDNPDVTDKTIRSTCSRLSDKLLGTRPAWQFGVKQGYVIKS